MKDMAAACVRMQRVVVLLSQGALSGGSCLLCLACRCFGRSFPRVVSLAATANQSRPSAHPRCIIVSLLPTPPRGPLQLLPSQSLCSPSFSRCEPLCFD